MTILAPPAPAPARRTTRTSTTTAAPCTSADCRVNAEPFRAWVRQLMSDTGLPWRVIARASRVPSATVYALLRGQDQRSMATLPQLEAERLFRLDHHRLAYLQQEPADPQQVRLLLLSLAMAGCSNRQIAEFSGIDTLTVRVLMTGDRVWCSRLQQVRAEAACEAWGINPDMVVRKRAPAARIGR